MSTPAIRAEGLVKHYDDTVALDGLDLEVAAGSVLGLLGPNGAGKTTAVRVFATLLRPTSGRAWVAGHDVLAEPDEVRKRIGLTGQFAAIDDHLTGRENLATIARLNGLSKAVATQRALSLLDRFDLTDAGNRTAKTYSGGMRRRLDLAASLVADPDVLFLDEPTTGLDPASRLALWDIVGEIVSGGTTVLLTTQYLEEADRLADDIVVIDKGKAIAAGTSRELKDQIGGERVEVHLRNPEDLKKATTALKTITVEELWSDSKGVLSFPAHGDSAVLAAAVRALDKAKIPLAELGLRRASLDDVFLSLTGHHATDGSETNEPDDAAETEAAGADGGGEQ